MDASINELAILAITLIATGMLFYVNSTRRASLPPGPRGIPFLGNLSQFNVMRPYPQV